MDNTTNNQARLAWRTYFEDGFPDLYGGIMTFLFGFFVNKNSTSLLGIVFLAGSILIHYFKKEVATKRIGNSPISSPGGLAPQLPIVILLCINFALLVVVIRGTLAHFPSLNFWLIFIQSLLYIATFIYIGIKSYLVRYFIYAGVSLLCGLNSNALSLLVTSQSISHFLMTLGVMPFIVGSITIIRYLRKASES